MFGWFSAKCPVTTPEKAWTEMRLCWLAEQFGVKRLLDVHVAIPDDSFFPAPYQANLEYAQQLMKPIGRQMNVNADRFVLGFDGEESNSDEPQRGHAEQTVHLRIYRSKFANPQRLAAALAQQISRHIFDERDLLTTAPDRERVIELLSVFFGLGIFLANSTVTEDEYAVGDRRNRYDPYGHWSVGRQTELPARVFGYALALFAFLREEQQPAWARHLRLDAYEPFRQSLRYLRKTNDTICYTDTIGRPRRSTSAGNLIGDLTSGTPSVRLSALWEIRDRRLASSEVVSEVANRLYDRDPDIPRAACETLAVLGSAADNFVPQLIDELQSTNEETRIGATIALGSIGKPPELVIPALANILADDITDVVKAAAEALSQLGYVAESQVPRLFGALSKAFADGNPQMIEILLRALVAISPDPTGRLREFYEELYPDLYVWALQVLGAPGGLQEMDPEPVE